MVVNKYVPNPHTREGMMIHADCKGDIHLLLNHFHTGHDYFLSLEISYFLGNLFFYALLNIFKMCYELHL